MDKGEGEMIPIINTRLLGFERPTEEAVESAKKEMAADFFIGIDIQKLMKFDMIIEGENGYILRGYLYVSSPIIEPHLSKSYATMDYNEYREFGRRMNEEMLCGWDGESAATLMGGSEIVRRMFNYEQTKGERNE